MNRKEKNEDEKRKKIKRNNIQRIIILVVMITITSIGILIVDYEANKMLGNEEYSLIAYCINLFN